MSILRQILHSLPIVRGTLGDSSFADRVLHLGFARFRIPVAHQPRWVVEVCYFCSGSGWSVLAPVGIHGRQGG